MKKIILMNSELIHFSRWTSKRFAIFASLNRIVKITFLLSAYFLTIGMLKVQAQSDTIDITQVLINSSRTADVYDNSARQVKIITAKQIRELPVNSVSDLLEYTASIDARNRGTEDVQTDLSIRGGTFAQVLILIDGISVSDPQTAHHNMNIPVSLEQIQRIEILSGPASRKYGANAFSGAINIVTKKQDNKISASLHGGSFGFAQTNLNIAKSGHKLYHNAALSLKRGDGYIKNTDFRIMNLSYLAGTDIGNKKLKFLLAHQTKRFGANSFYTAAYPDQYEETNASLLTFSIENEANIHWNASAYYRRHQDRFELFRYEKPSWYKNHNYHVSHAVGADFYARFNSILGKTVLGLDIRKDLIYSNKLGKEMTDTMYCYFEPDAFFTKSDSRNMLNASFEQAMEVGKWFFSAGMLLHQNSSYGISLAPGADIHFKINKDFKFIASYNQGVRFPSYTNLYYSDPTHISDTNLKPEKSQGWELGMKFRHNTANIQISYFQRNASDVIDWGYNENDQIWYSQNIAGIYTKGIELKLAVNPKKLDFVEKMGAEFSFLDQESINQTYISSYSLDYLRYKYTAFSLLKLTQNTHLILSMNGQDREGYYYLEEKKLEYKPFLTFDIKLTVNIKRVQFYASTNNLFNQIYYDYGAVSMPGRWIKMGVIFDKIL